MKHLICIYCREQKPPQQFNREHVIPQSFGQFKQNLVLMREVCRECNDYFGNTLDRILARESPQGVMRYLLGSKSISELDVTKSQRVSARLATDDPIEADEVTFGTRDAVEGFSITTGIKYWSSKQNKLRFISLTELESQKAGLLDDLDRVQPVIVNYSGVDVKDIERQFSQIVSALRELNLGIEIDEKLLRQTKPGEKLLVAIEVSEDEITRRAILKIGFNYLAKTQGREFVLNQGFDEIRQHIRYGKHEQKQFISRHSEPPPLYGRREAQNRRGHQIIIDWASRGNRVEGHITLFQLSFFKITFGSYSGIFRPIAKGHYFDIITNKVIEMQATRNPKNLWLPPT